MHDSPAPMRTRLSLRLALVGILGLGVAAELVPGAQAAAPASAVPTKRKPDRERGRDLWLQSCWECHGTEGKGDGPAAAAVPGGVPTLEGKISEDKFDALVVLVEDGKGRMPAYREDIDKHDARRILLYLRDALAGHPEAKSEKDEAAEETPPQN